MKKISVVESPGQGFQVLPKEPTEVCTQKPAEVPESEGVDDVDLRLVLERTEEIDTLTQQFLCDLMGLSVQDVGTLSQFMDMSELSEIEDEFEAVLASHGITIYRPTIITDDNGVEKVVDSIYE